ANAANAAAADPTDAAAAAAVVTANAAVVTSNAAVSTANEAVVTANAVVVTANAAVVTANAAVNTTAIAAAAADVENVIAAADLAAFNIPASCNDVIDPDNIVNFTMDRGDLTDLIVEIDGKGVGDIIIDIADLHNQPMPAGTKVTFSVSEGGIAGQSTFDWRSENHNGGMRFGISITGAETPATGVISVAVETPLGVGTSFFLGTIKIN
ncbi:MAG: hypothetical protein HRU22_15935, partial [Gammaproteobacteria bacterium]|nr:hypothetical protein [Gammaproteobacteria bacterium]